MKIDSRDMVPQKCHVLRTHFFFALLQVFVDGVQLAQVTDKYSVSPGTFYVDSVFNSKTN